MSNWIYMGNINTATHMQTWMCALRSAILNSADYGAYCGYNAKFLAYSTIASATFWALVILGIDTILGTGTGVATVGKDNNMEFGINLHHFDVVSLSMTSSSLSHLRL